MRYYNTNICLKQATIQNSESTEISTKTAKIFHKKWLTLDEKRAIIKLVLKEQKNLYIDFPVGKL